MQISKRQAWHGLCIIAKKYVRDIVFVLWLTSAGMAGDVPGICEGLVGRIHIFQSSVSFTTPYLQAIGYIILSFM